MATTSVNVCPVDQVAVLEVEGDLTSSSDTAVEEAFQEAVQDHSKVVLSFRQRDFINSAGIAILIDLMSQSQHSDVALRIAHPSNHFRKIFAIVGLTQHVPVFETVEDARRDF